ncbi:MAG: aminodeoxychorismate synthase component I [Desulfofustis sp.]|nr:aminodeoxychorismate synthase component I [Desulfofustis sp.]
MTRSILTDRQIGELLESLSTHQDYVFLDTSMTDSQNRRSLLFTEPVARLPFRSGNDCGDFLDAAERWLDEGCWLAGWLGYEFLHEAMGIPVKQEKADGGLLADLGVYRQPRQFSGPDADTGLALPPYAGPVADDYRISDLRPAMEEQQYCDAIRAILGYIAAGDTYQVNYTFKLHFQFAGSVSRFYRDLRHNQPVPYSAFIRNGSRFTLSLSPELFFRMESGIINARPMKGTMKRGRTGTEDEAIARTLKNDVKNRSENVMIVDLLRNDLSRLVENSGGGTVKVVSLFDIERYRTVFQMTSSIVARRFDDRGVSPRRILDAIFPCGSVTGAPKIRTMEIIDELETEPRGVYTGAIGFFSPSGEAVFNVPIRTVVIDGGRGEMGIGSGIVSDSSPQDEWHECLLKARFLTNLMPRYELIETMLYDPLRGFVFVEDHLARLRDSAEYLGLFLDEDRARTLLAGLSEGFGTDACRRVRLTLTIDGDLTVEQQACETPRALSLEEAVTLQVRCPGLVDFAPEATDSSSPWLYHKTSRRELYNRAHRQGVADGLVDMVFCNEKGEVTEGAISNIIAELDGSYYTPPVSCGLLPGVMRARLLRNDGPFKLAERVLTRNDLGRAGALFICNAVRGVVPVELRRDA